MITADAVRALGRDQEIGTISPGKLADLAILAVPKYEGSNSHEVLLDSQAHVMATMFRGRAVFGAPALMGA
jgi:imidazolonepropionase-like amidohydrolase